MSDALKLVAPLVGAVVGSFLGPIGTSVGWMVGSWLVGGDAEDKNTIIDPGAQEMPRLNSALRGITMPILFGTNRVPAQILWQHDFTTIRKETTESSGGGGGGSGGGGGTETTTTVSYQYKWDLIYHFGMVPEAYSLYGGWIDANRINDDSISAITNNSAGSYNEFSGFYNLAGIAQKASLSFASGFFYQGYGNGSESQAADIPGWSEISSDEGVTIRWPHTVWIGFKQMDLGSNSHIPKLEFEVGTGDPEFFLNTAYVGSAAGLSIASDPAPSGQMIIGDDGHRYVISGGTGNFCCAIYRYNATAGTYVLADSLTDAEFDADATALGLDPGSAYTFTTTSWGGAIPGHNYFIASGRDVGAGSRTNHCVILYKINSSGAISALGGYQARSNLLTSFALQLCIGISGKGGIDDPIMGFGVNQVGATFRPIVTAFPPISAMNGAIVIDDTASNAWDNNFHDLSAIFSTKFGEHTSYRTYRSFGWFLPDASISLSWSTKFYAYIGKSDVEWHNDNPASANGAQYIYNTAATYPNGHIAYASLGIISWDGTAITFGAPSGPTVDNANFVGVLDPVVRVPFDDAAENIDGTVDTNDDYMPSPSTVEMTRCGASGVYLVIFAKAFTGSEDMSPTGDYFKMRGFRYGPLSGKHEELGTLEGNPWDTVSDIGAIGADRYSHTVGERRIVWDDDTLYLWDSKDSASVPLDQTHFGKVATFGDCGGTDVLPPYIIYQILTNDWFGLGKSVSDIDLPSYQSSLAYCQSQGFKVSTQYRRDADALTIIEELLSVYGGFLVISNGLIKFKQLEFQDGAGSTVRTIDNDHLVVDDPGNQPIMITKGAKQDTFNKIRVNYIDRYIDYQQNQVEEGDEVDQDIFGIRMREFPPRFVMKEQMARIMAWRALWANLYSRDTFQFTLGWKDSDLEPGDVITLVDSHHPNLSAGITARIVNWRERERGKFDVMAKQEFEYIQAGSVSALSITSASITDLVGKVPSPVYSKMYELPAEFQVNDNGVIYCGWSPDEFAAGAFLWLSPDGVTFSEISKITPYPLGGTILSSLPTLPAGAMQENIEVVLFPKSDYFSTSSLYFNSTLSEAGPAVRAVGGSMMWVGSEMLAYETVTLVSQNHYRFSKVYRGWGGTPIGNHSSGDNWWKHGGGVFTRDINEDKIGTIMQYKVQPFSQGGVKINIDSIDAQTYTILGTHYSPQVPPTPRFVANSVDYRGKTTIFVNSTVDIAIDWRDSARKAGFGAGGFGIGGFGRFTVDPQSHSWRVEVIGSGNAVVTSIEVTTATYLYTSSLNFANNGAWRGTVAFKVTPFSPFGDSPRTEVLSLELWT